MVLAEKEGDAVVLPQKVVLADLDTDAVPAARVGEAAGECVLLEVGEGRRQATTLGWYV